jgi:hypothetical protein
MRPFAAFRYFFGGLCALLLLRQRRRILVPAGAVRSGFIFDF